MGGCIRVRMSRAAASPAMAGATRSQISLLNAVAVAMNEWRIEEEIAATRVGDGLHVQAAAVRQQVFEADPPR